MSAASGDAACARRVRAATLAGPSSASVWARSALVIFLDARSILALNLPVTVASSDSCSFSSCSFVELVTRRYSAEPWVR